MKVKVLNSEFVEITDGNKVTNRKLFTKGRQFIDFVFYYKGVAYIVDMRTDRNNVKYSQSDYYTTIK